LSSDVALTPTSYIVLGLLEAAGRSTPYELKQAVADRVGNMWSVPHSQVYAEPERLSRAGLVREQREQTGRRRRRYELTAKGRRALEAWRAEGTAALPELRDPSLLKLFFGADPAVLAPIQVEAHRRKLAEYERIRDTMPDSVPEGPRLALDAGIAAERQQIDWWEAVKVSPDGDRR
jgi:PadR family transcriptional regulator, regulatory protein AphA